VKGRTTSAGGRRRRSGAIASTTKPPRLQVLGDVAEAVDLGVLGGQVHDRVEHQVGEPEGPLYLRRREVADAHPDPAHRGLRLQPGDHGGREVDPVHGHTSLAEGEGDAPGADTELERPAVARQ